MINEYITKEDAARLTINLCRLGVFLHEKDVYRHFQNQSSPDVAPVIHAYWIREPNTTVCKCSHCGSISLFTTNYCGNCGAKIDEIHVEVADGVERIL